MDQKNKISIRNLYKIFGAEPEAALQHVQKGIGKADLLEQHLHVLGLQDINIDMGEGEITVIMGLSGSGKSTLIRHLNRLIEPTAGEIEVDGEDVLAFGEERLRRLRRETMSMVFQKFALFPHKTVADNAATLLRVRGADRQDSGTEANKWLDRVGLYGYGDHYPHQLSGGMQQRVGLARALATDTDIMLMDEAFSALDPLIRSDMQKQLIDLQAELKKTIVFITHDLDESLRLGDHIGILNAGKLVQVGTPVDIIMNPADEYVAAFVKDVNRTKVIKAKIIMTSVNDADGIDKSNLLKVEEDQFIEEFLPQVVCSNSNVEVVDKQGNTKGFITNKELQNSLSKS